MAVFTSPSEWGFPILANLTWSELGNAFFCFDLLSCVGCADSRGIELHSSEKRWQLRWILSPLVIFSSRCHMLTGQVVVSKKNDSAES